MRRVRLISAVGTTIFQCAANNKKRCQKLQGSSMSTTSRHMVLGLGFAGLLIDAVLSHPALAVNRVTLFKVTTPKQEIVIGLTAKELKQLTGKHADAVEKALHESGSLSAWQYSTRRGVSGEMEEAPVRHIRLASSEDIHVEAYRTKLKVVPITEEKMDEIATQRGASFHKPIAVN
jgi:hypothetical protein